MPIAHDIRAVASHPSEGTVGSRGHRQPSGGGCCEDAGKAPIAGEALDPTGTVLWTLDHQRGIEHLPVVRSAISPFGSAVGGALVHVRDVLVSFTLVQTV